MKPAYIRDLQPNQTFTSVFIVQSKDIRQKKSGEPYLSLIVGDRTGDVEAKMWDNVAEVMDTFDRDDFVRIKGAFQIYQNRPQITIHKIQPVPDAEVQFADFFPASERDPEEMFAELQAIIAGIANPHIQALLNAIFADERIARAYKVAPAAKQIHHAWLSGLLEHVLSLATLARFAASHYKGIDVDLLLAGVILHDIGKVDELTYDRGFGYSNEGQLIGHIMIGYRMVDEKLRQIPDFPPKLATLIQHLVLSHHGQLDFGSPKVPLFPEAMLLHHLDNLDSKMECMRALTDKDRFSESDWTPYSPALERSLLKKSKYLGEEQTPAVPATPAAATPPAAAPPQTPPAHAQPPRAETQSSLFGDKLKQALRP